MAAREINLNVEPIGRPIPMNAEQVRVIYDSHQNVYRDTTANWSAMTSYVPKANDIIIYTDKDEIEESGEKVLVPGIKIGDGNAYVVDLPFVTDALQKTLMAHINGTDIHVTNSEKAFWSNKLNLDVSDEMLIFNRQ